MTGLVKPSAEQCKDFIECGGGEFIETLPTKAIAGMHVVSCADDKKFTTSLAKMGVPIMDKEWMLSGLLKYKLDKNLKLKWDIPGDSYGRDTVATVTQHLSVFLLKVDNDIKTWLVNPI